MLTIDKYAYNNEIATWSPSVKGLLWLVGMIIAFQPILLLKIVFLPIAVIYTLHVVHVTFHQYLKWFYAVIPFIALSIIGIAFTMSPSPKNVYGAIHLFGNYFGLAKSMMPMTLELSFRIITAIVCTYWFALTTPFQQIILLFKHLHFPSLLIEETLLMYRFIFIFVDSFEQIYRAQELRFGYASLGLSVHSAAILGKMLFEQVIINYQKMTYALDAKIFQGEFAVQENKI
ncbi:Transmembrane component CbiQ of energizing module of cobalt ECF transporter [Furfurilactobacillus rossiae]|uniref:CbiQ family ECF transporter T component n=1 Tax=Furfurilactobacillus rossiae TaxID=231049 RepID=UPI0015BD3AC1|nr:CbiQ family ECF transporter T component [Furfurilactobacillus rossiae]MCF6165846.1 cobalt ECF transporter T component CbiQ [Furfurilactobacillus rossiae]QLE64410.1 Transmembrane component CbiQ of energizing module of cobalt ECF transporter [Furfurilactobacillus rossiae]